MPYQEIAVLVQFPVFCWAVYQMVKHGIRLLWVALSLLTAVILVRRALWVFMDGFPAYIDRGLVPLMVSLLIAVVAGAALRAENRGGG